jgi:SAM-dependent methyltransferase
MTSHVDAAARHRPRASAGPRPQPTIAQVYGQAYLWVERTGALPGVTELTYQMEDGGSYHEDAAEYFGGPRSWFPPDVLAVELARGRVLDIGCGAGRHALALARSGHQVVGLEPSTDAVAVARRRGLDAQLGSLSDPPRNLGRFDTFLLLGANLALLTTYPRPDLALARLAGLAYPGAQILGSDIRLPTGTHATSRLRVRASSGSEQTAWSRWEGGQPYLPPERLGDILRGSAWTLAEIHYPDEHGEGYLARLRLTT